ncbi:MAG TPA: response regulator [Verrucomicrobiae bacterium]|nr:response regulator [Verrucomicrobiae bacterium]
MTHDTILFISDQTTSNDAVLDVLKATGDDVVSTDRSTQAVAMLFVMHSAALVVLDQRAREKTSFELAHSLRAVRPEVPIVLLCREPADCLPSWVDACVSVGESLKKLTSILFKILNCGSAGCLSSSLRRAG